MAAKASKKYEGTIVDLIWTELEKDGLQLPNVSIKKVVRRGIRRITRAGQRKKPSRK